MSAVDLRFGDYRKVLRDVECDLCCLDAPYSERTHAGHDDGTAAVNRVRPEDEKRMRLDKRTGSTYAVGVNRRRKLSYPAWTPDDVRECVDFMVPRTRGWFVSITDHVLAPIWEAALQAHGLYTFSPLAFVAPGSRVRISGDGPAQWSCPIVVARPSSPKYARWGALPGAYVLPKGQNNRANDRLDVTGGKPLWLMQALVRDYSRPGETVCRPLRGRRDHAACCSDRRPRGHRRRVHARATRRRAEASAARLHPDPLFRGNPMSRRIVAVITIETDEAGRYYAHSDFCVAALSVGPWTTLLGCLDGLGRRLLDSMSFPRAQLAPNPVQDTTP